MVKFKFLCHKFAKGRGYTAMHQPHLITFHFHTSFAAPPPSTAQSETGDPWDKEVDDLVEWTANLDEQELE